jgi:DNA-binding NarL/FixJ family response regulator
VRIVIGEDSTLFREGLARLLADAGHTIVAKAADAPGLLAQVDRHRPDLAIIDVRMPPDHTDDGARAARVLLATPHRRVLAVLTFLSHRIPS